MLARSGESKRPRGRNPMDNGTCSGGVACIDGRYMPVDQAAIPITDWGYRRSDVTYDVVGVWGGAFFRLEEHIRRFRGSILQKPTMRAGSCWPSACGVRVCARRMWRWIVCAARRAWGSRGTLPPA